MNPIVYNITASLLTSGAVGLFLKLWLTHKLKTLEQMKLAEISENYRVKAKVFDERYVAYKQLSRLIAVALERGKSMIVFASNGWLRDFYSYANSMYKIRDSLNEVLAEHKIVVEPDVKRLCNDAVEIINYFASFYTPEEEQVPEYAKTHDHILEKLKISIQDLERIDTSLEAYGWGKIK